jgi:hypothetical protein
MIRKRSSPELTGLTDLELSNYKLVNCRLLERGDCVRLD